MPSSPDTPYGENALIRKIPPDVLDDPRFSVEEVCYDAGSVVFDEGDAPDYCYLVGSGAVRISKSHPGGQEELLAVLEPGDFFGELALYDGAPRSARATTMGPTRLGRLDRKAFEFLRHAAPAQLTATLADRSIQRVRRTNDLLVSQHASSPAAECLRCGALWSTPACTCENCHEQLRPAPVPAVLAGKFRLTRRVGVGGMGLVYHAIDESLDREVAVKTLPRTGVRGADALRREARAMAAVRHSHLAVIYGMESWRGTPMLVVEYCAGGTLADLLERGPIPLGDALELSIALAHALDHLHGAGFLHRDIKPSNVGIAADGTPKLLDFGLAHVLATVRQDAAGEAPTSGPFVGTAAGRDLGTLGYLSPEAARGEAPDPVWDLWALCITLYEAIAGRHPLTEGHPDWLLLRIAEADLPGIRAFMPDLPAPVADFFRDALSPDRALRPASARDLAARLATLHSGTVGTRTDGR